MTTAKIALLDDRSVVSVRGADAAKLLQGIITNDMAVFDRGSEALFAGLLTSQGKILFDFLVYPVPGGFLLDTPREKAADLAKRITMYRLRAAADIEDASDAFAVIACWPGRAPPSIPRTDFADPRHADLGTRWLIPPSQIDRLATTRVPAENYHAHRVALGVPEGGKDYPLGDTFPHEADMDLFHGVSFTKGCFVGQEVVARMEHKSVVRKRVTRVDGQGLTPGAEIKLGDVAIGTVGSVAGHTGLALVRLDRVAEALDAGQPLTAGGNPVHVDDAMLADYRARVAAKEATP